MKLKKSLSRRHGDGHKCTEGTQHSSQAGPSIKKEKSAEKDLWMSWPNDDDSSALNHNLECAILYRAILVIEGRLKCRLRCGDRLELTQPQERQRSTTKSSTEPETNDSFRF